MRPPGNSNEADPSDRGSFTDATFYLAYRIAARPLEDVSLFDHCSSAVQTGFFKPPITQAVA